LLEGCWQDQCRLLLLPGGADLPYCAQLNGQGNKIIRDFVEGGGSYIGLCAGAYYGSGRVEFEVDTPALAVEGSRELRFFPGTARGSVYKGFDYESERGAVAAPVRFRFQSSFRDDAVPESSPSECDTWHTCMDYVNGGPLFFLPSGCLVGINTRLPQGMDILATYPDHNHAAAALSCSIGLGRAVLCSSHPELAPGWLGVPSGGTRSDGEQVQGSLFNGEEEKGYFDDAKAAVLREELERHADGRWKLWTSLLLAAGLRDAVHLGPKPIEVLDEFEWSKHREQLCI